MAVQYFGNTISGANNEKPTLTGNEIGVLFLETDTGKLYKWDGSEWDEIILSDASTSAKGIASFQGGMMILFDQKTGKEIGVLVDECYLTNVRTAVAGGICAEILAPKNIESIGVIGTGVQARMQVSHLSGVTDCKNIKVWGRSDKSTEQYIQDMNQDEIVDVIDIVALINLILDN